MQSVRDVNCRAGSDIDEHRITKHKLQNHRTVSAARMRLRAMVENARRRAPRTDVSKAAREGSSDPPHAHWLHGTNVFEIAMSST